MIITREEAKTYCGITGTADDTVIDALIAAAQEAMESHCGRNLVETDVTEDLDGGGVQLAHTREPFQSVTAVYLDNNRAFGAGTQISASNLYLHRQRDGTGRVIEYLDNYFTEGQRNLRIVYKAGYSAATMPPNIAQACKVQVARMYSEWQRAKKGKDALASESVDGWSQTWLQKDGLDSACVALLKPYENWGM